MKGRYHRFMKNGSALRVGIVGSGSAGPAAACFLARSGHEVTLFERAPVKLSVGAGFLLQPTGMAVLRDLDLLDALLPEAARIKHLFCKNLSGTALLNLNYEDLEEGLFGAGTHRASLLDLLLGAAEGFGAESLWGRSIECMKRNKKGLPLLRDDKGFDHGPFDLVLICDGSRSMLRDQTGIPTRVDTYPWGALWFIGGRTKEFDPYTLWQSVDSTQFLTGFLPTGTKEDLLSLFWSVRTKELDYWKGKSVNDWRSQVLRLAPQAETFLNQVEDLSQLQAARYYDVRMKRWHAPNVAVLGDSAHALSPQLGQGVNLALMDAAVLANCISKYSIEEALPEYSKQRKKHLSFYQFATRWSTPFFQSDHRILGTVRDLVFPVANHIPWARKQMTMTMAGLKTGPFSQLPLEGEPYLTP